MLASAKTSASFDAKANDDGRLSFALATAPSTSPPRNPPPATVVTAWPFRSIILTLDWAAQVTKIIPSRRAAIPVGSQNAASARLPSRSSGSPAGDRRHLAVERHAADAVVAGVGHEQGPVGTDRNSARGVEPRLGAAPVAEPRLVAARDSAHAPALDRADAVVVGVGDEDHAVLIDRDADRAVEARLSGVAVGEAALARRAGDQIGPGRSNVNSDDCMPACIGDDQRSVAEPSAPLERQP